MLDFLSVAGQILCMGGLLYGAWLSITHALAEAASSVRNDIDSPTARARSTRGESLEQRLRSVSAEVWDTPRA